MLTNSCSVLINLLFLGRIVEEVAALESLNRVSLSLYNRDCFEVIAAVRDDCDMVVSRAVRTGHLRS